MREELLHYIWQYQLFEKGELKTTEGEELEILKQGSLNTDAGPDFNNAKIRIGGIVLAGNIEIHIHSKDWETHFHHLDSTYNSTILHVVFDADKDFTISQNLQKIPILVLKDRIRESLLNRYKLLQNRNKEIPCAALIKTVKQDYSIDSFFERLTIERLENKVSQIAEILASSNNDWEQVAFQLVSKYFGAQVNREAFFLLASSLSVSTIFKHQENRKQIEALFFGQAGFLEKDLEDDYGKELKKEYNYLKKLHALTTTAEKVNFKFLRLRPSNFPTIRLSQLAALMSKKKKLFSSILAADKIESLYNLFTVNAHEYWDTHYLFDKMVKKKSSRSGAMNTDILLINAVVPLLFAYGKYKASEEICERAVTFLSQIKAEQNTVTKRMNLYGFKTENAGESQSILELKTNYCDKKKCLSCIVGNKILKE